MKYFNCSICSCCGNRPEENEFAINNNNNINKERLQYIKTKNSATKIQKAYRAFKQRKNEEAKKKNNIKLSKKALNLSEKALNEYIGVFSGLPGEDMINDINNNNKHIKENIEHNKANKKKNNNNNINNDNDDKLFGDKSLIDFNYFLENNEFKENYEQNNNYQTTINNNIHSSLGQSNNSNNNNFTAPMGAGKTNEIHSANNIHKNFNKSFQENYIEMNNVKDNRSTTYKAPNNLFNKYFDTDNNINPGVNNQQSSLFSISNDISNDESI